jgi:hypothetical protein
MRFTRGLPSQAGTSVIAAIVVAAILGGIALGLHVIQSNSANTAALPAATDAAFNGTPTTQITPSTSAAQTTGSQQTCQQAIQNAAQSGTPTPKQQVIDQSTSETLKDGCNAAVLNPSTVTGLQQTNPGGWQHSTKAYMCVGKIGTLTLNGQGTLTEVLQPDASIAAGKCSVQNCSSSSNGQPANCGSAQQLSGIDSSALSSAAAGNGQGTAAPVVSPDTSFPQACSQYGYASQQCQAALATSAGQFSGSATAAGVNLPSNCQTTVSGSSITCLNSTQSQADTLQDQFQDTNNGNSSYICNYTDSNRTTICAPDQETQTPPSTCPAGQTGTPPNNCTPATPVPPPAGPQQQQPQNTNGGGLGSGLSSFLSGLAKGLTSSNCYSTNAGGNGSTLVPVQVYNPTTGTYSQTYVQSSQPTGVTSSGQPCTPQQQAPYGVGSNGAACNAPPAQPQCAANATPMPISASGNGCVTSYQCVPINGSTLSGTPTPQISCSPQIADVNESVAISYSCQNATGSSGGGFSTNNQLSGSASTTISAPPSGTNTANFGLTCTNNGQTASAQCSVQVNQPAIDLVADPQAVPSDQTSSIGWITAGMQSCIISSADDATFTSNNAGNTSVSGVAQTDAITGPTNFTLTCQTLGGQTKTATTEVTVGTGTSTAAAGETITASSTADGQSVNHGSSITVNWQSASAPSGSVVSLWLIDVGTEQATALIAGAQPVSGTYQWQIPATGASCDPNSIAACASNLVAGDSYGIEASLYTPSNAFLGGSPAPTNAVNPSYSASAYTPTPFTIGQ